MSAKVSLAFARASDMELDNFAQGVINRIIGNATYPPPPVTIASLQTAKNDFTMKIAAAHAGGKADTAAKNNSRQTLIGMLRQIAMYVQINCSDDMAPLLTSRFEAQSTNRASVTLEQPKGLVLTNGSSGQLVASVSPVKNTNIYEGRAKVADGRLAASVFTGDSQHIIFDGLTAGTMYTVQVRSLGGATGQSDWSDPSTHMAM
jgi:hypothetical protein